MQYNEMFDLFLNANERYFYSFSGQNSMKREWYVDCLGLEFLFLLLFCCSCSSFVSLHSILYSCCLVKWMVLIRLSLIWCIYIHVHVCNSKSWSAIVYCNKLILYLIFILLWKLVVSSWNFWQLMYDDTILVTFFFQLKKAGDLKLVDPVLFSGWEGGDEWLRAQFKVYLQSLLVTCKQDGQSYVYIFLFIYSWLQSNSKLVYYIGCNELLYYFDFLV